VRRRYLIPSIISVVATLSTAIAVSPATAAGHDYDYSCFVTRLGDLDAASGGRQGDWSSKYKLGYVGLYVRDNSADGHHVAVRLVTTQADGDQHYWSWHRHYDGNGTGEWWDSSATDSEGIKSMRFQVAVFEGDQRLGSCLTPSAGNPNY
jgi:hypothetical protein